MPSPFPGMDPYLETPSIWPDVHQSLITYARDSLMPQVRPRYLARMGERVFLSEPARGVFLEILDPRGGHVVTVIEFLSPVNKAPGEGRELYLKKQQQVMESDANLVEVDLLRRGDPTLAVPADGLYAHRPYDYLVCISRSANRGEFHILPRTVRDPLPRVGIPLRPEEPEVLLDLPTLVARAYENGAYDEMIDYSRDPDPPFGEPDATWVREMARTMSAPPSAAP